MNSSTLAKIITSIRDEMVENKDYLVELDQQNGDGDLGISMANGYTALAEFVSSSDIKDLGMLLMKSASVFNESAPSSLGTITSFGLMGMAKSLKGKEDAGLSDMVDALQAGLDKIMEKAKSKPGEKTILDSLYPAIEMLKENSESDPKEAFRLAYIAADEGSESTKNMLSVHGRAAYYGDKSLGVLDGGSVVGKLIFKGIYGYFNNNK
ncbi:MAG: dihydroxyacetone kinase subunit L [Tissierellaceae bacterium]|nr:dihydroxyacetone kinase subunit L [Tissierellaceae bacterium]